MKRRDLIRKIEEGGAIFIRHGGKHDWYMNPETKMAQPVPRHSEIKEFVAQSIIRKLAGPREEG
ncbi:MAG TPA: type II toxin-antitoxin system HicA family toxin [Opitutaceae bacterium]|nr:type II toxin-antitoxin system HicA family toxin [Opitutaceae bacterium]